MSDGERTIDKMPHPPGGKSDPDANGSVAWAPDAPGTPPLAATRAPAMPATAAAPRSTAPTPPYRPEPSPPVTMVNRPEGLEASSAEPRETRFVGELDEDFETTLGRVKMAARRPAIARRIIRLFEVLLRARISARRENQQPIERKIAFDGFRTNLHDQKVDRDRLYGTVYTVSEELNAYLVRLEFPRLLPDSSLKQLWGLADEMPDYNYSISLDGVVLSIHAGVPGEAYRRLSYISASFPSDFLTRIEFRHRATNFKHRLREKTLEIVVFKAEDERLRQAA